MTIIRNDIEYKQFRNSHLYFSKCGKVWNTRLERPNTISWIKAKSGKINQGTTGYSINGKKTTMQIHRGLWETWKEKISEGLTVDHIDSDPTNNDLDNLQLMTPSENLKKAWETKKERGVKRGSSKGCKHQKYKVPAQLYIAFMKTKEPRAGLNVQNVTVQDSTLTPQQ